MKGDSDFPNTIAVLSQDNSVLEQSSTHINRARRVVIQTSEHAIELANMSKVIHPLFPPQYWDDFIGNMRKNNDLLEELTESIFDLLNDMGAIVQRDKDLFDAVRKDLKND